MNQVQQQIADYLKTNMGLDAAGIDELIDMLDSNTSDNVVKAEQTFVAQDFESLSRVGHSIKGSSANLGATELAAAGQELEFAAKAADPARCQAAITELKAKLSELQQ